MNPLVKQALLAELVLANTDSALVNEYYYSFMADFSAAKLMDLMLHATD